MFRPYLFVALLAFGKLAVGGFANEKEPKEGCPPGPQHMRAAVRHIEAGGIGYNTGYSSLDVFLATDPNRWRVMPFLDLRGHVFNNGTYAANGGIGARGMWGCRAYGINGYYDFRNTNRRNFNQVSAGLETLGKLWDLRVNGYLPVGKKLSHPYEIEFAGFSGNSVLVRRKFQYAMKGIDGEVGFHFGKTSNFDFYAAAGPYYFKGEIGDAAVGGKGRIAGYYKDYVTLEVSDSWDSVYKNNVQGQLTLSLPFGPKSRAKLDRDCCLESCDHAMTLAMRMVQPVARQEMIVIDSHKKTDPASNFVVFMDNESSSQGTFESPFATLADAQDNSSIGDIIYVFPGDGTTTGMTEGIVLKNKQKFWGSGVGHGLKTNLGKIYIPPYTNTSPQMTSSSNGVTLAADNDVSGFTILYTQLSGIYGDGNLGDTTITSCVVYWADCYLVDVSAIDLTYQGGSGNVVIDNVLALDTLGTLTLPGEGIYIAANNSANVNVLISNSMSSGNSYPIDLEVNDTAVMNAVVSNSSITNNTNEIYLSSDSTSSLPSSFTWNGNTIAGPVTDTSDDDTAIYGGFRDSALVSCYFNQNSITNVPASSQAGIFIQSFNTAAVNISADGNRITGTSNPISTDATEVSSMIVALNNNSISGNGALLFTSASSATTPCIYNLVGNVITGSSSYGLDGEFSGTGPVILTATSNSFVGNTDAAFFHFTGDASSTLTLAENTFEGTLASGGVILTTTGGADVTATVQSNLFSYNEGVGFHVTRTASMANTICLTMIGNSGTHNGVHPFQLTNGVGGGNFTLAPCDAQTVNFPTSSITISGTLTNMVESCATGTVCP